jgi:hypothetical protein
LALAEALSARLYRILQRYDLFASGQVAFYTFPLADRLVFRFNPASIGDMELPPTIIERIQAALHGRRVIQTLAKDVAGHPRSIFLQIAYEPGREKQAPLQSLPLDLDQQPDPYHIPIGQTAKGPLWLSILEMDSVLIGGARRMGKTYELHAWIQALLRGGKVQLVLWDGKGGLEFGRYAGHSGVTVVGSEAELSDALQQVSQEARRRERRIFPQVGVTNLPAYLKLPDPPEALCPIVLILDELANLPDELAVLLSQIVRTDGAYGVHPVIGIQRPDAEVVKGQLRANLATRIALPTVSVEDSRIVLQRPGAEKLPRVRGRMLLVWDGRLVEAQGFQVTLPQGPAAHVTQASLLSPQETQMVSIALELDGWFHIQEIARRLDLSDERVNAKAKEWQVRGWLTDIQYDKNTQPPRRLGRRITPVLVQMAGLAGFADSADSGGSTLDLGPLDGLSGN